MKFQRLLKSPRQNKNLKFNHLFSSELGIPTCPTLGPKTNSSYLAIEKWFIHISSRYEKVLIRLCQILHFFLLKWENTCKKSCSVVGPVAPHGAPWRHPLNSNMGCPNRITDIGKSSFFPISVNHPIYRYGKSNFRYRSTIFRYR